MELRKKGNRSVPLVSKIRIALSGKSGAGKTELANALCSKLGIQRCSTGDIYRQIATIVFGEVTKEDMNALTKALRGMDPFCVLEAALRRNDNQKGVVLDSVRFKDDALHLRSLGFLLVRIESGTTVRHTRMRSRGEVFIPSRLEADETETDIDDLDFDVILANESSPLPLFLEEACARLLQHVGDKR